MNRHEGVSCDSCLKNNFRGRRYKCLICIDYDLCAVCYESAATTNQHTTEHPMQCILSRSDFDLYYGGEALALEQPQAYTCPFCNRMGFTDTSLIEHVTADHADTTLAVVCPVCASMPGGEPNFVTDDFAGHLTLEHRTGPRDLISFLDEPSGIRHGGVRRIPHSGRGVSRARRTNMQFSSGGGISSLSPSSRDAVVDPIAELLSQLSGVRRGVGQPGTPSQLQQLQIQLQLERQQATAARQQLERLPRRPAAASSSGGGASAPPPAPQPAQQAPPPQEAPDSQMLLSSFLGMLGGGDPSWCVDFDPMAPPRYVSRVEEGDYGLGAASEPPMRSLAPPPVPQPAPPQEAPESPSPPPQETPESPSPPPQETPESPSAPPQETSDSPSAPPQETSDSPSAPPQETSDSPSAPPQETPESPSAPPQETPESPSAPPQETSDSPSAPPQETPESPSAPPQETFESPMLLSSFVRMLGGGDTSWCVDFDPLSPPRYVSRVEGADYRGLPAPEPPIRILAPPPVPPPAPQPAPQPAPPPAQQPPPPQEPPAPQLLLSSFTGASTPPTGEEAESRAALLRGLMLASLGRAAPAPPPPPAPRAPPPAQPQCTPPAPAAPAAPAPAAAHPMPRAKPQPRTKEAAARAHAAARQLPEGR